MPQSFVVKTVKNVAPIARKITKKEVTTNVVIVSLQPKLVELHLLSKVGMISFTLVMPIGQLFFKVDACLKKTDGKIVFKLF